jgi:thioredoxin reductase (NADPH)
MRECLFLRNYSGEVCLIDAAEVDAPRLAAELRERGVRRVEATVESARVTPQGRVELDYGAASHAFDVLYSALGATPRTELARQLGANLDRNGAVVVDTHCESSVPGFYAAGDVVSALDQIAVAVGHAAIAATAIHNRLRGE